MAHVLHGKWVDNRGQESNDALSQYGMLEAVKPNPGELNISTLAALLVTAKLWKELVSAEGLEPSTHALKGHCSTN
jgi:hypothetical protein